MGTRVLIDLDHRINKEISEDTSKNKLFPLMSQLTTLLTGAGVVTTVSGQAQCEQYIVVGDVDTTCPLTGLQVEVDGESKINIQGSTPLVSSFMKYMMEFSATVVALMFKISLGKITKNTTYRFTNAGATTPIIYAFSTEQSPDLSVPVMAATKGINALSYDLFQSFTALMITPSANVGTVDILFTDGNKNTFTVIELDAWFAMNNPTQVDGRLDAVVTTIDNRAGTIKSVQVNATTAVTVMVVKVPDIDHSRLRQMVQ